MGRPKKVLNEEKYAEWNIELQTLLDDIERQYKSSPSKATYDLLVSIELAQKCIE